MYYISQVRECSLGSWEGHGADYESDGIEEENGWEEEERGNLVG